MKLLHTSDWHLGCSLYGRKRYQESAEFLDWLLQTIRNESVDALLIAGDIFDSGIPSNRAAEMYYRFLGRVSATGCRHVVVIAGNHDSPSFLNAPRELLRELNVYVIGSMTESPEDEVITLYQGDRPEAVICAVPYLRDKDIRTVEPGESIDDKNAKLMEGLKSHYLEVCSLAEQKRTAYQRFGYPRIPVVAMGHLFTAGGRTVDGDGVRELYVGSLAHVGPDLFPAFIDYVALGHLHVPQSVDGLTHIRYCGSPVSMGYGESTQAKTVVIINFMSEIPDIREIRIPCFQPLARIAGSLEDILAGLDELNYQRIRVWLEIEYTGDRIIPDLREQLDEALHDSSLEILRIKNKTIMDQVIRTIEDDETLDDLDSGDVFTRCLDAHHIADEEREELIIAHSEIVKSIHDDDPNAE